MSNAEPDYVARLRRAAVMVKELELRVGEFERAKVEPIAIIGMGCRFPGGGSHPAAFFQALKDGVDAVRAVPADRWPSDAIPEDHPATRWAALLDAVDGFDASFFGIAPREAMSLDPQQRLLLEVAWEALEDAGQRADLLMGSQTGVFIGISLLDYQKRVTSGSLDQLDAYSVTGNMHSTAAGRLSYVLGLEGPCLSVDTACSSSLVSVHLACQSLRNGESALALAGGVNLILSPVTMYMIAQSQALSPDGRCKTFDAGANGYVRGEGSGIVVLKRLSDAHRDGDRIWALIRGSAVNQDGRSTGLTTPNVLSQQALLRTALANAHVSPYQVSYIEAHGTGTSLGDPIEVEALKAVLGQPRPDGSICALGTVKTNLGHLEAASGMAGLIKTVLALKHEMIPRHLHFQTINPRISLEATPFVVPVAELPWRSAGTSRIAGVSSFGISGTNAHVVLEEAPRSAAAAPSDEAAAIVLPLSAKSPEALSALALAYRSFLSAAPSEDSASLRDIAYTASVRRSHHEHRLALVGRSREELVQGLDALLRSEAHPGVVQEQAGSGPRPKVVFVFAGQGSQWVGMGRELLAGEPIFRAAVESCDALMKRHAGFSLLDELGAPEASSRLGETFVAQPALFAIQIALAELWRSWGVVPDAVVGHSVGEVAAAHLSGSLSLEEAIRLVVCRGRVMQPVTGLGKMAAVALSAEEAISLLRGYEDRLAIAAINDPGSVVLSGEAAALEDVMERLQRQKVRCQMLRVNYAFHSPQVAGCQSELLSAVGQLVLNRPALSMYSTVTGAKIEGGALDAVYWARNLREPVQFARAIKASIADGHRVFLEIGPHPVLVGHLQQCLDQGNERGRAIATLRRGQEERPCLLKSLGALYAQGYPVEWKRLYPSGGRSVALPTYPWQRQRYWLKMDAAARGAHEGSVSSGHPLLGAQVPVAGMRAVFETALGVEAVPYLSDHRVFDRVVVPGTAVLELLRAAAARVGIEHPRVSGLVLQAPLVLPESGLSRVQVVLSEMMAEGTPATVYSQASSAAPDEGWTVHATGHVQPASVEETRAAVDLSALRARCRKTVPVAELYAAWGKAGLVYGPAFLGLKGLWEGAGEAISRIELPAAAGSDTDAYGLHPALLDAALQTLGTALGVEAVEEVYLPFEIGDFTLWRPGATVAWVHARATGTGSPGAEVVSGEVTVVDERGEVLAEIGGLRLKRAKALTLQQAWRSEWLYQLAWPEVVKTTEVKEPSGTWLVLTWGGALGEAVVSRLGLAGARCIAVAMGGVAARGAADWWTVEPNSAEAFGPALAATEVDGSSLGGVVCLWGAEPADETGSTPVDRVDELTVAALSLVQALARRGAPVSPRLWWVTEGAQGVHPGERVSVSQAPLWGLGRVVMQEHPELGCRLVDLERDAEDAVEALWCELTRATDEETQVAWRGGKRHGARLVKAPSRVGLAVPEAVSYRLETAEKGLLEQLRLVAAERRTPGAGEVELEVLASGLNFRDVLNALGMYPGEAGPLGNECAGVVTAVGEGVEHLSVGDAVMALTPGAFSRFVTADARLVVKQPAGLSAEQAATVPIVFLTAWYALHDLGGLKAGERVLIHAAAGGVGMAAVQVAQWVGAEVLATASPSKWDVVRAMGVTQLQNSRTLAFAEAFRAATQGAGVDVVLNALSGAFVDASAALLSPAGRFLEMGKTDLRSSTAMASTHPGVVYRAFDLWEAGPERIQEMLGLVSEGFASGHLRPLPVRAFAMTEAEAAFRWMAQARHTGKIALLPASSAPVSPIVADSTVLITGGLGALGLYVARWLWEEHHVQHLILSGRRAPEGERLAAVEALRAAGARVTVAQADVADASEVRALLGAVPAELPLRGVIHAAGMLDDGLLTEQDRARFTAVLAPKVRGAWNLHAQTRDLPLGFFVLFSSAASLLGSAGQGNYAAGNAFLDALSHARRAEGLCAHSVNWGPWSEGGMAERLNTVQRARLIRQGIGTLSPAEGVMLLGQALLRPEAQLGVLPLDLRATRQALGSAVPAVWRALLDWKAARLPAVSASGWALRLLALAPEERLAEVEAAVRMEVAKVLSLEPSGVVRADRPLQELGLDSLMAVELRNALAARAGKPLPATLVFDYPTVGALTRYLLEQVLPAPVIPTEALPKVAHVADGEPIAIVGMGCRYPGGVRDLESFWRLLDEGVDAIGEVPKERWDIDTYYDPDPDAPGKMITRSGGFLEEVDRFDPSFFGISPREAVKMDPQQRLLLETSWEALERAGLVPERLLDSDTGVFVGLMYHEYGTLNGGALEQLDGYVGTGNAGSVASGRISYLLGIKGPSLTVDTACSSSLVAIHLACQSLRAGECSVALAGGVTLILTPAVYVEFSRLRGLSVDGRSKSFDASADGVGWSEGCGMVALKRLSDAKRDGDPILAVIRGSAVNQDGRSNGLTAPNGPSQEAVIRRALEQAAVAPSAVGYVEAHGTGTPLGDPIELQALGAVLGEGRAPKKPVVVGSVKSNFGHTQAAAGVAGVIKAVLSFEHERIPRTLHFTTPNPRIAWGELPVQVAAEAVAWPASGAPRIAGVSSFGISGTNAHVVLEEAPRSAAAASAAPVSAVILPLSAKSADALSAVAEAYRKFLSQPASGHLGDIAYTASVRRSHHEHRLSVVGRSREELAEALDAFLGGATPAGVARGQVESGSRPKVVFVFAGQGSQWVGMGRELLAEEPVFRAAVEACEPLVKRYAGFSLLDELGAPEATSRLQETEVAQPALFALQVGLSELWRWWGVVPDAVVGHSVGEVAAAHVAGVLSLEEAIRLVCCRGRVMQRATGLGKMASVALSVEEASLALEGYEDRLSVAAVNDPGSVVLSGEAAALSEMVERLQQEHVSCSMLRVNYAFHSPQMAPFADELGSVLGAVEARRAELSMYSTVSGAAVLGEALDTAYWTRNIREPVQFGRAVEAALRAGHRIFVEVGPHPVLAGHLEQCLEAQKEPGQVVSSLRRDREERRALLSALGLLYTAGVPVGWERLYPSGGRCVALPAYPWQRQRYWLKTEPGTSGARGAMATGHPLLGARLAVAGAGAVFETSLVVEAVPYLLDYMVFGQAAAPVTVMLELIHAAAVAHVGAARPRLRGVVLHAPLLLPERGEPRVQVVLSEATASGTAVAVYSQASSVTSGEGWTTHATAEVQPASGEVAPTATDLAAVKARCSAGVSVTELYATWSEAGIAYGPALQGITALWRGEGEAVSQVALPAGADDGADAYGVHPALLDAALQTLIAALCVGAQGRVVLPFEVQDFIVWQPGATAGWVHARRTGTPGPDTAEVGSGDITVMDDRGEVLAEVVGLRLKRAEAALRQASTKALSEQFYELAWQKASPAAKAKKPSGTWLLLTRSSALGEAVATRLGSTGARCVAMTLGEGVARGVADLLAATDTEGAPLEGVVCLWGAERPVEAESTPADRAEALTVAGLSLVQALVGRGASLPSRLWWVTEGAQAVSPGETVAAVEAPLWGLGRVVMQEHPELGCTLLDLELGAANAIEALWSELTRAEAEDETQVAWRAGERHVARLVKASARRAEAKPASIVAESTVLITGGLGTLGLHVARWLWEEHHVQHLVLVGRRAPEGERLAAVEALRASGARVTVAQADVADASAVQGLLAAVPAELPLRGVIHAAGMLDDGVLAQQDAARFAAVLAPKVRGAWNLHVQTRNLPLDFFVLFSSAASLLGTAGQSNYAAANAFLDALAQQRRAEGLLAHSLNWGPWAEGGMAEKLNAVQRTRLRRQGIGALSPAEGLALLGEALGRREAQLGVLSLELGALRQAFSASAVPPVWRALVAPRPAGAHALTASRWAARLGALAPAAQVAEVEAAVRAEVARALKLGSSGEVPVDRPLKELGFDSLMTLELRNALTARAGQRLPATLVFDYPTVEALTRYLLDQLLPAVKASAAASSPAPTPTPREEPIAIVGIGCRYPGGVRDLDSFWRLLEQGVDAIEEVPKERWDIDAYYDPDPDAQGKMVTRWGGFLEEVDLFDPGFFEISPREAVSLDPQQRLLLEASWEALERAGQTPERLLGSDTGVYMGICSNDYQAMAMAHAGALDPYVLLGTTHSTGVARLSYWLGLKGPNMPVNTACSSSLVAVHLACQALRTGECSLALAGGVNLMLTPEATVCLSGMRAMSPTGRCRTFSADSDGYVRSEGCGVVVLKRLSDAAREGDPILAVIRGSAVNQDGRSNGLTAPNGPSQEAVIRRALAQAGVAPSAVGYVETHGTGTPLGDPIEVQALGAVMGEGRAPEQPVVLGSVKTNIGHTEGAAGVAGLIKAVLSLQHGSIPKSLHLKAPNPHILWEQLPVKVAVESVPWPANGAPRIAGVSSFGISGTNAHVVLEEAPAFARVELAAEPCAEEAISVLPLSAQSSEALAALADSYRKFLAEEATARLGDIAYTASVRRSHHAHRLSVVGRTREELSAALEALGRGEPHAGVAEGQVKPGPRPKVVFVYPGQGSQWVGMGRALLAEEPVFRAALEACDQAIGREAGFSVLEELRADASQSKLAQIDVVQPTLFAIEVALSALWRSWGVEPDAVVGHSMGEVAAAHVAGALTLQDAARIICRRSGLLRQVSGQGAMALVELSLEQAEEALSGYEDRLSVAVNNSPRSTVLSGEPEALSEVLGRLTRENVFNRRVKVDVASHSPQMDPLRGELLETLSGVVPSAAKVPMYSTVTGAVIEGEELVAKYWARNLREPVLFSQSIQRLLGSEHALFVEMSPHPILLPAIEEGIRHGERTGVALPSLRRDREERRELLSALGALYAAGYPVEWKRLYPSGGRCVPLPTYPFQRERYWLETAAPAKGAAEHARRVRDGGLRHPLLGASFSVATQPEAHFWEQTLSVETLPYLAEHRVESEMVLPGAAYVEMALSAAAEVYGEGGLALEQAAFERMLAFPPGGARVVQVVLTEQGAGQASFHVSSREEKDKTWVRHATGSLRVGERTGGRTSAGERPRAIQERCGRTLSGAEHYQRMAERGLDYGPRFKGVEQLWVGSGEVLGRVRVPEEATAEVSSYQVHPAVLDACFQVLAGLIVTETAAAGREPPATAVPVGIERVRVERRLGREVWVHGRLRAGEGASVEGAAYDLQLVNDDGQVVAEVQGLRFQSLSTGMLAQRDPQEDWLYALDWRRRDHGPTAAAPVVAPSPGAFLVLMDRGETGAALSALLHERGEASVRVVAGERYGRLQEGLYEVDPSDPEGYRSLLRDAFGNERPCRGVVHLWSLDATATADTTLETLEADQRLGSVSALYLAQALVRAGWRDQPRLLLVTRGAQAVGEEPATVEVSQAPVWGLGRTLTFEHPELGCTRVDLSPTRREEEAPALLRELVSSDGEDQIALRKEGRYVARLVHRSFGANAGTAAARHLEPAGGRPFRLEIPEPGVLERLTLRETERRSPGPGEVEIEVDVASLNFIDVMKAMGIYPGLSGGPVSLGGECAGRIVRVGEGVVDATLGQDVVALAAGTLGSHVTTPARFVVARPSSISAEEASSVPLVFMTVYYALLHLGRLQKGERVLIHSAAGGVGLAAVQIAQRVGAEIFATAGTAEKRELLRSMGIRHVMDSRSLSFAEEVLEATRGEGVDVVLNSLAGEAISKSMSVLANDGRFLEIGKRDIYADRPLGLSHFRKSLSYTAIDLAGLIERKPALVSALLREVMAEFEAGRLKPLPYQRFTVARVEDAFRCMAQGQHVGKIVVALRDPEVRIAKATTSGRASIRADGSYLITGGLGGLGLSVAAWMVREGARHVVLTGRSGASEAARVAIAAMEEAGAEVRVIKVDVSRRAEVKRMFAEIETPFPPLRGIVHAAGILEDHTILELSREHFLNVMAPKVQGAWNLHALTLDRPLDFFVLYSSAASLLGSPGQGNYAAANAFLDALSHHRRRLGLPGLSINWGPFAEVGLAAAHQRRGERLSYRGMGSLSPAQGVEVLGRLLSGEQPQVGVLDLNLRQWLEFYPSAAGAPIWSELPREGRGAKPSALEALRLQEMLAEASPGERPALLERHIAQEISRVLRLLASKIERLTAFTSLGMDSLMSLELRNRLESSLGLKLSATLLFTYPNLAALTEHLLDRMNLRGETENGVLPKNGDEVAIEVSALMFTERFADDELLASFDEALDRIKTENLG